VLIRCGPNGAAATSLKKKAGQIVPLTGPAAPLAWHRPASGPLRREQIDALLEELRDPALARQFLMDAGLIDADGQLTAPYRSQDARTAWEQPGPFGSV
jgi:hypothetical protein